MSSFRSAALALSLLLPLGLRAQMHHVDKADQVTRAVGVYEWTGEITKPGATRLVPVSLFIDGRFQDAGTYGARPVPFVLETGNVYSIEIAGKPLGTLDINLARDVATARSSADDNPVGTWYGYGIFAPPSTPKPKPLQPTKQLSQVAGTEDDDRPHFVAARPQADDTPAAAGHHAPTPTPDDDTERPTLGRRADTASTDTGKKPKKAKDAGYVTGVPGGLNDDPDRPSIRRGKSTPDSVPQLDGLPAGMHQAVAVSDPAIHEPHIFTRGWESVEEREATLVKLRSLAAPAIRDFLTTNALVPGAFPASSQSTPESSAGSASTEPAAPRLRRTPNGISTSTAPTPSHRTAPHATAARGTKEPTATPFTEQSLQHADENLAGYELSYGGLPTFVYTVALPVHPAQARSADLKVYALVVAQRLPSGGFQLSLSSVTDSGHLDRTPWMRFVDVVDADGSHRGSLLMELRGAHSRQFALFRLISAQAEQTFTTGLIE